jgi:hypothetical protein
MVKQRAGSLRQGMQYIYCPHHIQPLPEPLGARRPRADAKALRVVARVERLDGFNGHRGRWRHIRKGPAIRSLELERPIGPARDLEALLVHRAVMPAAEQREVRERGRSPVRPVAEMMPLAMAHAAAREAAALVSSVECAP